MRTMNDNPTPAASFPSRAGVALAAAGCCLVIAIFEALLAAGAPLGRAAFGGKYDSLPTTYRVASLAALGFWSFASLVVLSRGGLIAPLFKQAFTQKAAWALVAICTFGAILNLASSSPWERLGWSPFTALLAFLVFILARSPSPSARPLTFRHPSSS